MIAALTKDPSAINRIRVEMVEQQGNMDLQGQLGTEKSFREKIAVQIEYIRRLRIVGARQKVPGEHPLGSAIGELECLINESWRQEVGLKLDEGSGVRPDREHVAVDPRPLSDTVRQLASTLDPCSCDQGAPRRHRVDCGVVHEHVN